MISINLLCNFIEITLWQVCSPVNLLHIFRPPFCKNTSGRLLLLAYPTTHLNFMKYKTIIFSQITFLIKQIKLNKAVKELPTQECLWCNKHIVMRLYKILKIFCLSMTHYREKYIFCNFCKFPSLNQVQIYNCDNIHSTLI